MTETLLIVVLIGVVMVIALQLLNNLLLGQLGQQIHQLKEVYSMTTAELLAVLNESNTFTAEIASDLDELISKVENAGNVDPEVAAAASALRDRLTAAAGKYQAETQSGSGTEGGGSEPAPEGG
jgi:ABC-type transporter Mla subunit MlaD